MSVHIVSPRLSAAHLSATLLLRSKSGSFSLPSNPLPSFGCLPFVDSVMAAWLPPSGISSLNPSPSPLQTHWSSADQYAAMVSNSPLPIHRLGALPPDTYAA